MARLRHDSKRDIFVIDAAGFLKHWAGTAMVSWTAVALFLGIWLASAVEGAAGRLLAVGALAAIYAAGIAFCGAAYARRERFEIDVRAGSIRRAGKSAKQWPIKSFQRIYLSRQVQIESEHDLDDLGERRMIYRINFSGPGVAVCVAEGDDKARARKMATDLARICDLPLRDGLLAAPVDARGGRRPENWEIWANSFGPQEDRGAEPPSPFQDPSVDDPERGRGAPSRDSSGM